MIFMVPSKVTEVARYMPTVRTRKKRETITKKFPKKQPA